MLNWKTLKKLGDAVLFSNVLGSYKTQDQIKIRLDSTKELFKRYVGRVYENTLPSVSEVEAKEGDMCILIVDDEYTPYEVVGGVWKKYSNGNSSSGGGSVDLTDYYTKSEVNSKLSNLDSKYVRVNDTTLVKLNNENEINLQEDHYNAWFGYRDGKVTNWKFGDGTEGGYANIYAKEFYLNDQKLSDLLGEKAKNSEVVKYTDFATTTKGGVIKFSQSHGITMSSDGFLMGATRTAEQYTSNSGNMLINKGTLENVFNSKGEDWEFTLSDGSTVTKKIVCA